MNPEEREWEAQEAAARCDRSGSDVLKLDALGASYLSVVRAAGQPIDVKLPADFASRVARLAGEPAHAAEIESGFERRLLMILVGVLGVAALATAVLYGGNWLFGSVSLVGQIGKPSLSLLTSMLACLGLSALWPPICRILTIQAGSAT